MEQSLLYMAKQALQGNMIKKVVIMVIFLNFYSKRGCGIIDEAV